MRHIFFMVLFFLITHFKTFSQTDSIHIARNVIFIELAGVGGLGSINYERELYSKKYFKFSIRCGVSTYNIKDYTGKVNPDIFMPFMINGMYGRNHKIEFGIGETFSNVVYAGKTNFEPTRKTNFHTISSVGYRYQKNTGGIIFRCNYTPILEFNRYLRHWAGISFGYSF